MKNIVKFCCFCVLLAPAVLASGCASPPPALQVTWPTEKSSVDFFEWYPELDQAPSFDLSDASTPLVLNDSNCQDLAQAKSLHLTYGGLPPFRREKLDWIARCARQVESIVIVGRFPKSLHPVMGKVMSKFPRVRSFGIIGPGAGDTANMLSSLDSLDVISVAGGVLDERDWRAIDAFELQALEIIAVDVPEIEPLFELDTMRSIRVLRATGGSRKDADLNRVCRGLANSSKLESLTLEMFPTEGMCRTSLNWPRMTSDSFVTNGSLSPSQRESVLECMEGCSR